MVHIPSRSFHYTGPAAALSILQTDSMWLSNISFMNDATEGVFGRERIVRRLHQRSDWRRYAPTRLLEPFDRAVSFLESSTPSLPELWCVYIGSTSKVADDLGQFNAYGQYQLELDLQTLTSVATAGSRVKYAPVVYGDDAADRLIDEKLDQFVEYFTFETFGRNNSVWERVGRSLAVEIIATRFHIKHAAFANECEIRISAETSPAVAPSFRVRGDVVVPYIVLPLGGAVTAVHLGPRLDQLAQLGMSRLLSSVGMTQSVTSSAIPFR